MCVRVCWGGGGLSMIWEPRWVKWVLLGAWARAQKRGTRGAGRPVPWRVRGAVVAAAAPVARRRRGVQAQPLVREDRLEERHPVGVTRGQDGGDLSTRAGETD